MKTEIIYGIHPVWEALSAGRRKVFEIFLVDEKLSGRIAQIKSLADSRGISQKSPPPGDFNALAG
ncbi:MAG: 23S rRNA (guanosine(2251)-2'-O)-methyltransferase RlmB, partial [Deltaproteobacteria bacterium]|nr:23S rRNA (guanosine(2251)-2'-O)-methyltransferase RlmB [Deltaproteobacteria bacterium]